MPSLPTKNINVAFKIPEQIRAQPKARSSNEINANPALNSTQRKTFGGKLGPRNSMKEILKGLRDKEDT